MTWNSGIISWMDLSGDGHLRVSKARPGLELGIPKMSKGIHTILVKIFDAEGNEWADTFGGLRVTGLRPS